MDRIKALELWDKMYPGKQLVMDCFGTYMHRDDYDERVKTRIGSDGKYYNYGWQIDHILAVANNGPDDYNNYEIMHYQNNVAKSDHNTFKIGNTYYQVIKVNPGYGIKILETGVRVDWKAKTGQYFK